MPRTMHDRLREEQMSRTFDYGEEFRLKVSVEYGRYIFLSPKTEIQTDVIIRFVEGFQGYEKYRMIRKVNYIIHVYLQFQSPELAKVASEGLEATFKNQLHIASVSDMLEAMYAIEGQDRTYPLWTATIIDTVGDVQMGNPLQRGCLANLLHRFGEPRVFEQCWEGPRLKNVQALFSSMAEALGASIVLGNWQGKQEDLPESYHYRVRIVAGQKEHCIFNHLRIPNVKSVFDMEYFISNGMQLDGQEENQQALALQQQQQLQQQQYEYQNYQANNNYNQRGRAFNRHKSNRRGGGHYQRQVHNRNRLPVRDQQAQPVQSQPSVPAS